MFIKISDIIAETAGIIAATGSAIFILGFGHLVQKKQVKPKGSLFFHYFIPLILLLTGAFMLFTALKYM